MKKVLLTAALCFGMMTGFSQLYIQNNTTETLTVTAGSADDCMGTAADSDEQTLAPWEGQFFTVTSGTDWIAVHIDGDGAYYNTCGSCGPTVATGHTVTWVGPGCTRVLIEP